MGRSHPDIRASWSGAAAAADRSGLNAAARAGAGMLAALLLAAMIVLAGPARGQGVALTEGEAQTLLAALAAPSDHGLPGYGADDLRETLAARDSAARAEAERMLVARTLAYAEAQHRGRVTPSRVDRNWDEDPAPYDPRPDFERALADGGLAQWLESLPPRDPRYHDLLGAYATYRAMAAAGGWPQTPDGPSLRAGDSGPAVAALRARLSAEGFGCPDQETPDPALFDAALDCAVKLFQDRRGLEPDGVVGAQTLDALNVTATGRARQIAAAMERWRWAPRDWPADRIEVNTAVPEATLYRDGAPVLKTRLVAGKPSTPTPTFHAAVEGVVINPPWNVPSSIARNEILPKAAADPGYLARNHYRRTDRGLVQTPGAHNALGRVKLDMPNPHTVYLHDTPARTLFAQARRYYSHGCMRMQYPREMAAELLADQGWTAEALDAAIEAGETQRVALTAPVPVFVFHHTAYRRDDGALVLQPDVYGWDARLTRALEGAEGEIVEAAAGETECAPAG